jgi:hypothetical protein
MINRSFLSFIAEMYDPLNLVRLTGKERQEARYSPREKKKDKLLSLLKFISLYQYSFSFFLSSVFLSADETRSRTETMRRNRRFALFFFLVTFCTVNLYGFSQ